MKCIYYIKKIIIKPFYLHFQTIKKQTNIKTFALTVQNEMFIDTYYMCCSTTILQVRGTNKMRPCPVHSVDLPLHNLHQIKVV